MSFVNSAAGESFYAVDRDGVAALEVDRHILRLVRRLLRIVGARIDVIGHLLRGVFEHLSFRGDVQKIGVGREGRIAALVLGDRNLIFFGEVDQRCARREVPFAPGRDDRDVGLERVIAELEAHLIVALARRAVADGVGSDFARDLDLLLGDERARDRSAEQIKPLILRIGAKHREDVVAHEFLAQILDEDMLGLDAEKLGLGAGGLQLLALSEVGGEGDDLRAIFGLQPFQDDRRVEPSRIGENDALDVFLVLSRTRLSLRHDFPRSCSRHNGDGRPIVEGGEDGERSTFVKNGSAAATPLKNPEIGSYPRKSVRA